MKPSDKYDINLFNLFNTHWFYCYPGIVDVAKLSVLAFQFDRPMTLVSLSAVLSDFDSIVSEKKRLLKS